MPTARQLTDRIARQSGAPPRPRTVDGFVHGDPGATVGAVATVTMPTLDALRRVVDLGCELVVAHEPLYYDQLGSVGSLEDDPVATAKRAFLDEHRLVVWRFHDGWHDRRPDGILAGVQAALGGLPGDPPGSRLTLARLARHVSDRLGAAAPRVVGDPDLPVDPSRVVVQPGFVGFDRHRRALAGADVLVIGEGHEWEIGQYVTDAAELGLGKGLVVVGHAPSEAAGMAECARWLRGLLGGVRVEHVAVADPYQPPRG